MQPPPTRYADSRGVSIAYQVIGNGPVPIVIIPGFVSNVEIFWSEPLFVRWMKNMARFSTVILLDKRGTGLSDPMIGAAPLEVRMDDARAVMDHAGVESAVIYGVSEGGPMAMLFAATYPERTRGLVLYGTFACGHSTPEHPFIPAEVGDQLSEAIENWGEGRSIELFAPDAASRPLYRKFWGVWERTGASRGMARALLDAVQAIDVRPILPTIAVPTLVLHRAGDRIPIDNARYIAEHIPGASLVELPGNDHVPFEAEIYDRLADEVERFFTGGATATETDRVLSTVLFTDIVRSTETAVELGDDQWHRVLDDHDALMRSLLNAYRGRAVKSLGDGFLATFDGPARAIECSLRFAREVGELSIAVRAGIHTGECEVMGDDIGGIAVHIAARVAAMAVTAEVLVTSTVRDLVVGSGLQFAERGKHSLKGVPGEWALFRAEGVQSPADRPILPTSTPATGASDRVLTTVARRWPRVARATLHVHRRVAKPPAIEDPIGSSTR